MALVELDDDLVKELTRLLNHSNKQAVEMGFRPWTLSEMIRDMIWSELRQWQNHRTINRLRKACGVREPWRRRESPPPH